MTLRDRIVIVIRLTLLIIAFALASNLFRHPEGALHYGMITTIVFCLVVREHISYDWLIKRFESRKEQ
jgi:hypothetical protein